MLKLNPQALFDFYLSVLIGPLFIFTVLKSFFFQTFPIFIHPCKSISVEISNRKLSITARGKRV